MIAVKIWVVGEVMPLGSDSEYKRFNESHGRGNDLQAWKQVHTERQGRSSFFGPYEKHDATVMKIEGNDVHIKCSCGSEWMFPQPRIPDGD